MADTSAVTNLIISSDATIFQLARLPTTADESSQANPIIERNKIDMRKLVEFCHALVDTDAREHADAAKELGEQIFGAKEFGKALEDLEGDDEGAEKAT